MEIVNCLQGAITAHSPPPVPVDPSPFFLAPASLPSTTSSYKQRDSSKNNNTLPTRSRSWRSEWEKVEPSDPPPHFQIPINVPPHRPRVLLVLQCSELGTNDEMTMAHDWTNVSLIDDGHVESSFTFRQTDPQTRAMHFRGDWWWDLQL